MKRILIAAGLLTAFMLLLSPRSLRHGYAAEEQGQAAAPAAQPAAPGVPAPGMMGGPWMMGGPGMMGGQRMVPPPHGPCPCMMGRGPMGYPRPGMMGMGMGMMGAMGGMGMFSDPKTRGELMQIRGRMLQQIGQLMEQRGKDIAAGKK